MCSAQWKICSMLYTVQSVHYPVHCVQLYVCSAKYAMRRVQCTWQTNITNMRFSLMPPHLGRGHYEGLSSSSSMLVFSHTSWPLWRLWRPMIDPCHPPTYHIPWNTSFELAAGNWLDFTAVAAAVHMLLGIGWVLMSFQPGYAFDQHDEKMKVMIVIQESRRVP